VKINLMSIFVEDQEAALAFYTDILGFVVAADMPAGDARWITVTSPEEPEGTQLVLEPSEHPAVAPFKTARTGCALHPAAGVHGAGHHGRVRRHLRQPDPDREYDGVARWRPAFRPTILSRPSRVPSVVDQSSRTAAPARATARSFSTVLPLTPTAPTMVSSIFRGMPPGKLISPPFDTSI
jgi:catechol 2,3-dioxygenase-like lactoylglutathione lyase family enzyme